ncbi:FadR/GntR family transcriptional regulator [Microbaculum marinum]|uniref:FadR/GntR family transcriptional regulator n=1 Tax=Microbaculum marinum TaxID=1764581 RepID=A0AAW9RZF1_9HYPH
MEKPVRSAPSARRSVYGQIVDELGRQIVTGEFEPGSILPSEGDYSAKLAVSRTSFREAIKMLAGKGLVESRPKTGTRVRQRSQWHMLDPDVTTWAFEAGPDRHYARAFFEFRGIIEPAAAALAAERRGEADLGRMRRGLAGMAAAGSRDEWIGPDLSFHRAILAATGNELLISLGHLLEPALTESFAIANVDAARRQASVPLHRAVYVAIDDGRPDDARSAMAYLLGEALVDLEEMVGIGSNVEVAALHEPVSDPK